MVDGAGSGLGLDDPRREAASDGTPPGEGSTDPAGAPVSDTAATDRPPPSDDPERSRRARLAGLARLDVLALAVVLLPLVVSAVALVVGPGGGYLSSGDWAAEELAVRDIGRHPVLIGLYSRADWSHPGPLLYYLLAPFYWLSGRTSIGLDLGALAVNGAAIVGMALVARRRGGLPLMLSTLAATALLLRTVGADFVHDPWVCYVTTLPFGLLIFLVWAAAGGERWALPVAVLVASFLAQTHIGFVLLAPPLVLWGAAWLAVRMWRAADGRDRWRDLARTAGVSAGVLVVCWLPPLIDVVANSPSNARRILEWFQEGEEFERGTHTLTEGWRVMTGQFLLPPEWLTSKRPNAFPFGEPAVMYDRAVPWLLVPVAGAVWFLGRRLRSAEAGRLAATLGLTLVLGMVAIARTVGPAFDYRLRWTWIPAMVAFALTAWAGWLAVGRRWPEVERRLLAPGALVALALVSGINLVTAATTGMPYEGETEIVTALAPEVRDAVGDTEGQVVVDAPFSMGTWWSRGLVVDLERHGIDARVPEDQVPAMGEHRLYDDGRIDAWLVVVRDEWAASTADLPGMELVARWSGGPASHSGARQVAVFLDTSRTD